MRRPLILIVILVVLLGILWLVQARRPVVSPDRLFVTVDSAQVTLLRIETATDTIVLQKQGEGWMLTKPVHYPAAERTVASTLGKFREMKQLSMITNKKERHAEFEVDAASAARVTVSQGKKSETFYVGKSGPTAGTTYARREGSDEVWEIGGSHTAVFKRKAKDWRDKTITELSAADVQKLTFTYPDRTLEAVRADTVWTVNTGKETFEGNKTQIERVTGLLSRLSAYDFADTLAPNAFDKPDLQLKVELQGGDTIELKLLPKEDDANLYFLRKTGAMADFVIYKSTANVLMMKEDDLRPGDKTPAGKKEKGSAKKGATSA